MRPQDRTRAILRSGLSPVATLVAIALADHCNGVEECHPSQATIVAETRLGGRTVRRVLAEADGTWVTISRREGWIRGLRYVLDLSRLPPPGSDSQGKSPATTAGVTGHHGRCDRPPRPVRPARVATVKEAPREAPREAASKRAGRPRASEAIEPARSATPSVAPATGPPSEDTLPCATSPSPQETPRPRQAPAPIPPPHPTAPLEPGPSQAPLPPWAARSQPGPGVSRADVLRVVVGTVEALRGGPPNPERCGTAAKPVLALWRALGWPPADEYAPDLALVVEAAARCPDPLFARDVRGVGWDGAPDRSRDLSTLCVQARWDVRLEAARRWRDSGRAPVHLAAAPSAVPPWLAPLPPGSPPDVIADDQAEGWASRWAHGPGGLEEVRAALRASTHPPAECWRLLRTWIGARCSQPDAVVVALRAADAQPGPEGATGSRPPRRTTTTAGQRRDANVVHPDATEAMRAAAK
mgnify:CR=1 FL=1